MVERVKVLVTGGSGFVGTYLVRKLLSENNEVAIMDRLDPSPDVIKEVTHYRVLDLSNLYNLKPYMFKDVDIIIHTAAKLPIERCTLDEYRKVNVVGTDNLLMMSSLHNISKFVHISSSAVYGDPKCPVSETSFTNPIEVYGQSKVEAEYVCQKYRICTDMNISIIRPRTILGRERLGAFYLLFLSMKNNRPLYTIGNGKNKVQLISVNDLVDMIMLLIKSNVSNEDFNVGTDRYGTLNDDIGRDLVSMIGSKSKMFYLPATIGKGLCRALTKVVPIAPWHYELVDKDFYFDISKTENMLGWKPKDSNVEMLYDAYQWYINEREHNCLSVHKSSPKSKIVRLLAGK